MHQGLTGYALRSFTAAACAAAGFALAPAAPATAQLHEGDVILIAQDNAVVTGAASAQGLVFPQRVFAGAFGSIGLPNRTPDPGFNSVPGQFVTNALVDVRIRRAARKWDPVAMDFCAVPEETVEIRRGTRIIATPASDPADPAAGPVITIGATDPLDGLIHQHPAYWLTTPFSDGVYLVEVQVEAPPLAPSAPIWLLFAQNAPSETIDDAVAFAETRLAAPGAPGDLCACAPDLNGDGAADLLDLLAFVSEWTGTLGSSAPGSAGDFNADGTVDLLDLLEFLSEWIAGC